MLIYIGKVKKCINYDCNMQITRIYDWKRRKENEIKLNI